MYTLTAITPYTAYPIGTYPTIALCEEDCEGRYRVRGLKFKQDNDGVWRCVVPGEEGAIVLKLVEVKDAPVDS